MHRRFMTVLLCFVAVVLSCGFLTICVQAEEPKKDDKPAAKSISLFDGKTLGGWTATKFGGEGKVEVKKEQILLGTGEELSGVTWTRDFPKVNYEIELDAMRVKGFDFFCGLTFPYKKSHCSFIVGGWGGTVVGLSSVDGYDASDNQTSNFAEFKTGKWYHIRVRVTDKKIETWIDKKKFVDLETKDRKITIRGDIEASKPLGVATWQTAAALKNIRYRLIKDGK